GDGDRRRGADDLGAGGEAVLAGHADVEQGDIGTVGEGELHGLPPVTGLGHHLDGRVGGEDGTHPRPDHLVVVREQDPDHFSSSCGSVAVTSNSRSRGPARSVPPASRTCSRSPARPERPPAPGRASGGSVFTTVTVVTPPSVISRTRTAWPGA